MGTGSNSLALEFVGGVSLGDRRRDLRFRTMVEQLATKPCGKVSEVFQSAAERQGAYDFLEHETVSAEAVQRAGAVAAARRCASLASVYLVLDGSCLTLTDAMRTKGFGSIGSRRSGARGLKLLNALAVDPNGRSIGVLAQQFWVRGEEETNKKRFRPLEERESYRWHQALDSANRVLGEQASKPRVHVVTDREGDASLLMQRIVALGNDFTIRTNGMRLALIQGQHVKLRPWLQRQRPVGQHTVAVPAREGRPARIAVLQLRRAQIALSLRDRHTSRRTTTAVTVVWAREETPPKNAKALDWMLYTTVEVRTGDDARQAVKRYTYRWRVEDFHRLLKSGGGCVEDSQLRSVNAAKKWATLHTIVAARALRLRDAARTTPELPASTELSETEIEALVILKAKEKRRTETISEDGLTIKTAVRWLADLGGFTATGKSLAPPGAIVIGRGLERVLDAAQLVQALRDAGKLR